MPFRPYHTGLRKQVDFEPLDAGSVDEHGNRVRDVLMYNCGPTVYGVPHIGNYRSFLFADLLRRYLDWRVDDDGTRYKVTQVMNITDVGHLTEDDRADAGGEDKLQGAAEKLGWDPFKVARHFEELFFADLEKLGVKKAHHYPRATDHIADMLDMIQALIDRGHAYVTDSTGEVYFHVPSYPEYGKLSGKDIEANEAGARVEVLDVKRDPRDFALWKVDAKHLMQWDPHDARLWSSYEKDTGRAVPKLDPRIGKGFPGWHIECSAMSRRYLGVQFDIHTGGEDNIFPHHECEIAQSVGAHDPAAMVLGGGRRDFVNVWMHARHLLVDGKKMSKSAGTLYTLADLEGMKSRDGGSFTAADVRWALISQHYRQPMNFTIEGLEAARASLGRLRGLHRRLKERAEGNYSHPPSPLAIPVRHDDHQITFEADAEAGNLFTGFRDAMDDDLGVAEGGAALFEFVNRVNPVVEVLSDFDYWVDRVVEFQPSKSATLLLDALESVDRVLGVLTLGVAETGFVTKSEEDVSGLADAEHLLNSLSPGIPPSGVVIHQLIATRLAAKKAKDYALADRIRKALADNGVTLEDTPQGVRWTIK